MFNVPGSYVTKQHRGTFNYTVDYNFDDSDFDYSDPARNYKYNNKQYSIQPGKLCSCKSKERMG